MEQVVPRHQNIEARRAGELCGLECRRRQWRGPGPSFCAPCDGGTGRTCGSRHVGRRRGPACTSGRCTARGCTRPRGPTRPRRRSGSPGRGRPRGRGWGRVSSAACATTCVNCTVGTWPFSAKAASAALHMALHDRGPVYADTLPARRSDGGQHELCGAGRRAAVAMRRNLATGARIAWVPLTIILARPASNHAGSIAATTRGWTSRSAPV